MLWTTAFWKGAAERGIKTFAQTLVGYIIVGTTGLLDIEWATAASVAGAAALASLLTSIGNADFVAGEPPVVLASPVTADDLDRAEDAQARVDRVVDDYHAARKHDATYDWRED